MTTQRVNPQFIESIQAGLKYWQRKTQEIETNQAHWLDRRRRNLFQAVIFGIQTEETWEATVEVLLQSFNFVEWGGYWQEWIPIIEQALASAPEKTSSINGRLHNRLGQLYKLSKKHPVAIEQHEQALLLAEKLNDKSLSIVAHASLCEVYLELNMIPKAKEYAQTGLSIALKTADTERLQAFLHKDLGAVAQYSGDWEQAVRHQKQAIQLWRKQNNLVYLARSLIDLGISYTNSDNFLAAQQVYEEAGAILNKTINESDKALVYLNLGVLFYRQEKWTAARDAFLRINPTALRERNNQTILAKLHNNLGNVYLKLAQLELSIRHLTKAIKLCRTLNDPLGLANSLGTLGEVLWANRQLPEAMACYQEALQLLAPLKKDGHWPEKLYLDFSAARQQIQKELG